MLVSADVSARLPANTPFEPFSVASSPVGSVGDDRCTVSGPLALVSMIWSCTVLLEPYSERSRASVPAPFPTPPVIASPKGCGPIATVGASMRTV